MILQVILLFIFIINITLAVNPRKRMPYVPRDIMLDVFGFLSRKDLNDDLFISKGWYLFIEGAGKHLPQRQKITMDIHNSPLDIRNRLRPFMVDFSNGEKTIRLTDEVRFLNEDQLKITF